MNVRRLITTFVIGPMPCHRHTLPFMRAYASKCRADFLEVKYLYDFDGQFHGNPNYSCVAHLLQFSKQTYYDEILMLDADVIPVPGAASLFDMPGDMVCVQDRAWPTKDERYRRWLRKHYPDSSELTAEGPYFNAGVLLYRREAAARMDLSGPYPDDFANDQDFLNMRAGEAGLDINWLGYEFNERYVDGKCEEVLKKAQLLHFVARKHHIQRYADFLSSTEK